MAATLAPLSVAAALSLTGWSPLGDWRWRYDLDIYLAAGRAAAAGAEPYAVVTDRGLGFTYPPAALAPFIPLSDISPAVVHAGWVLAVALVVAVTLLALLPSHATTIRARDLVVAATLCAATEPVYDSMHLGQVSPFVGAAAVLAVALSSSANGAWLGLAGALKVAPLGSGVGMLAERRPTTRIVASGLAFVLVTGAAWAVAPGLSVEYWTENLVETSRVGSLGSPSNTSLAGALAHAGLPDPAAQWAAIVLAATLTLWWIRSARRSAIDRIQAAIGAGALVVLATPVSWSHHALVAALAAALCWLAGRQVVAVALTVVWAAPLFEYAATVGGPMGLMIELLRPASLLVIVGATAQGRLFHPVGQRVQGGWSPQGTRVRNDTL
ncbi:MAG: glycosyltransferase 87 family protein [Dermatophilaceae bacterium]